MNRRKRDRSETHAGREHPRPERGTTVVNEGREREKGSNQQNAERPKEGPIGCGRPCGERDRREDDGQFFGGNGQGGPSIGVSEAHTVGVVVLIGREHRRRRGTDGMMGWIVRARPAQPHGHGMTSPSAVVAVEVAPAAGRQGQQQAHQNGSNQYSGDGLHIQAIGSQEWGNSIAPQAEDVNRCFGEPGG